MKKIIIYIQENIRLPLIFILMLCISNIVTGQSLQLKNDKHQSIIKPVTSPAVITKDTGTKIACGIYPDKETVLQSATTIYSGNECTTTIKPGSSIVYFKAHDKIILLPGFTAQKGSRFIAQIDSNKVIAHKNNIVPDLSAANNIVSVAPNPFSSTFVLSINAVKNEKVHVAIYNSVGAVVKKQQGINLIKGTNTISFNASEFASGVYTLEINYGYSKIIKKIVKG